jgi:hypothetical protein
MINLEEIVTNKGVRNISQVFREYGESVSRASILPGHYYSFDLPIPSFNTDWGPNSIDEYRKNPDMYITDRQYYNLNPTGLTFFHEKWKENALVLDIKIIPPAFRSKIIMTHLNLIEKNLDAIGALAENEYTVPFNERGRMNLALYGITPTILEQATGLNLKYAISAVKLDRVSRAVLLDWTNIGELPLAGIDDTGLAIAKSMLDITGLFEQFEIKQL